MSGTKSFTVGDGCLPCEKPSKDACTLSVKMMDFRQSAVFHCCLNAVISSGEYPQNANGARLAGFFRLAGLFKVAGAHGKS